MTRSRIRAALLVAYGMICTLPSHGAESFRLWGNLSPGPYAVGFRAINAFDRTHEDFFAKRLIGSVVRGPIQGDQQRGYEAACRQMYCFADAYKASDDPAMALRSYRKLLQMEPGNGYVKAMIDAVTGTLPKRARAARRSDRG